MDNDNDENLIDDYSKKKDYRKITEEEKGILNDIQTLDEKIQKKNLNLILTLIVLKKIK